jgi:two-component system alkaline phosphatase synthesis response regulator PhoP
MKAIFRRMEPRKQANQEENEEELIVGEIVADVTNYHVTVSGKPIVLTPKEFELLVYFMKRKGRVIDRDTLLERIWHFDFDGQSRIVDVHVSHLREKIEQDPKHPQYLQTVRGFGYKFLEPNEG